MWGNPVWVGGGGGGKAFENPVGLSMYDGPTETLTFMFSYLEILFFLFVLEYFTELFLLFIDDPN